MNSAIPDEDVFDEDVSDEDIMRLCADFVDKHVLDGPEHDPDEILKYCNAVTSNKFESSIGEFLRGGPEPDPDMLIRFYDAATLKKNDAISKYKVAMAEYDVANYMRDTAYLGFKFFPNCCDSSLIKQLYIEVERTRKVCASADDKKIAISKYVDKLHMFIDKIRRSVESKAELASYRNLLN